MESWITSFRSESKQGKLCCFNQFDEMIPHKDLNISNANGLNP